MQGGRRGFKARRCTEREGNQGATDDPMRGRAPTKRNWRERMTTSEIQSQITAAALQQGIDPSLALAVAKTESNFNPNAVSNSGAIGVMQLMPATAAGLNVNPSDPTQNIQGGVKYLADLLRQYNGDVGSALAAYNEGPTAFGAGKMYPETKAYVASVLAHQGQFSSFGSVPPADSGTPADSGGDSTPPVEAMIFGSSIALFGMDVPLPLAVAGMGLGVYLLAKLFGD